jgi:hypothetical protein
VNFQVLYSEYLQLLKYLSVEDNEVVVEQAIKFILRNYDVYWNPPKKVTSEIAIFWRIYLHHLNKNQKQVWMKKRNTSSNLISIFAQDSNLASAFYCNKPTIGRYCALLDSHQKDNFILKQLVGMARDILLMDSSTTADNEMEDQLDIDELGRRTLAAHLSMRSCLIRYFLILFGRKIASSTWSKLGCHQSHHESIEAVATQ